MKFFLLIFFLFSTNAYSQNYAIFTNQIESAGKIIYKTYKEGGAAGLTGLSSECYKKQSNKHICVYIDTGSRFLERAMVDALNRSFKSGKAPYLEYFDDELYFNRIGKILTRDLEEQEEVIAYLNLIRIKVTNSILTAMQEDKNSKN